MSYNNFGNINNIGKCQFFTHEPCDSSVKADSDEMRYKRTISKQIGREKMQKNKNAIICSKEVWKNLIATKPDAHMSHREVIRLATLDERKLLNKISTR